MAEIIPQSATRRVLLKVYLSSDHLSDAIGKTVAVTLSKNGGAFANPSAGATNATEVANGWYYVDLSTTDTNTNGPLVVRGTAAGCDNVERDYTVGVVPSNVVQVRGTAVNTGAAAGYFPADANVVAVNGDSSLALALENLLAGYENTGSLGGPPGFNPFRSASALAGASGSVTLDSGASAVTDFYAGAIVVLHAGTGAGQARLITAYNGTTKVATVTPNWATPPDNTTVYAVVPRGPADVRAMTIAGNASVGGNFSIGGALTMNAFGCATTFTVTGAFVAASASNDVRVNVKKINDAALLGVGTVGNEWRPA